MNKIIAGVITALLVVSGFLINHYYNPFQEAVGDDAVSNSTAASKVKIQIIDKGNYREFVPVKTVNPFVLEQVDGEFTNQDLINKWTFVIFGYTYCPDVCPTTLTRIKAVLPALKSTGNVQIVFVSADPLRDTAERLAQYVNYFDSSFLGLTTNHKALFPFAQNLYLPYGIVTEKKSDNYAVNHSASIALINPKGEYVVQFKPEYIAGEVPTVDMKAMAKSFEEIVKNNQ